jgi:transcription initiation factor IIE alpha subunit
LEVNSVQQKIIDTLKDKGLQDPKSLAEILQIKESDLERELAALRHMEKVMVSFGEMTKNANL